MPRVTLELYQGNGSSYAGRAEETADNAQGSMRSVVHDLNESVLTYVTLHDPASNSTSHQVTYAVVGLTSDAEYEIGVAITTAAPVAGRDQFVLPGTQRRFIVPPDHRIAFRSVRP